MNRADRILSIYILLMKGQHLNKEVLSHSISRSNGTVSAKSSSRTRTPLTVSWSLNLKHITNGSRHGAILVLTRPVQN